MRARPRPNFNEVTPQREHFSLPFEIQEIDPKKNTFAGMAVLFGSMISPVSPYWMYTFYMPGSLEDSIVEDATKIKIFDNHEYPIGLPIELKETDTDPLGLFVRAKVSDTNRGRDTMTLIKDRVLTEMSIGSLPDAKSMIVMSKEELLKWLDDQMSVAPSVKKMMRMSVADMPDDELFRIVTKAQLWEVSVVPWGADPNTYISEAASIVQQHESLAGRKLSAATIDALKKSRRMARQIYASINTLLKAASMPITADDEAQANKAITAVTELPPVQSHEEDASTNEEAAKAVNEHRARLRNYQADAARHKFRMITTR